MSTLGKKTVEDIEVKGRNVLVRCDFNVPMKDGVTPMTTASWPLCPPLKS